MIHVYKAIKVLLWFSPVTIVKLMLQSVVSVSTPEECAGLCIHAVQFACVDTDLNEFLFFTTVLLHVTKGKIFLFAVL